jgi:glucokinase
MAIAEQTGAEEVVLLNDLQATARGILNLPDDDFVELNPNAQSQAGNIAVLAAGTGLGEAIIHWDGTQYHVIATEGGHTDFAPTDTLQIELLQFLMAEHPEHVSYERVVCGQGLTSIYRFLITQAGLAAADDVMLKANDPAAMISEHALQGQSPLCEQALSLFCQVYGAEAGNLALKSLSYRGVVLAGGIAAKILPFMQNGVFLRAFLAKGRFANMLNSFSIRVCLNSEVGLLGAAYYLVR